jgi:hypothetical protein
MVTKGINKRASTYQIKQKKERIYIPVPVPESEYLRTCMSMVRFELQRQGGGFSCWRTTMVKQDVAVSFYFFRHVHSDGTYAECPSLMDSILFHTWAVVGMMCAISSGISTLHGYVLQVARTTYVQAVAPCRHCPEYGNIYVVLLPLLF